jgi:rhodanese-related sulfurtransferase
MPTASLPLAKTLAWRLVKFLIRSRFPTVPSLSTQALAAWLEQETPPLLLDARKPAEYEVSHLPTAQLASPPPPLPPAHSQPIVVYCSVGYRSARLAHQLQQQGYSQVFNLEGSLFQWANEDRPLYRGDRLVKDVHPYNQRWGWFLNKT